MRKKNSIMKRGLIAFAVLSVILTACGSRSDSGTGAFFKEERKQVAETMAASANYAPAPMMMAEETAADYESGYGMMAGGMYNDAAASSVSGSVSEVSEADAAALHQADTENSYGKLIRTVNVSLQTQKYDELASSIRKRVSELGGYIENSNEYSNYNDKRSCYLVARIPQDKLDEFLNTALTEGTVVSRSENVEDISSPPPEAPATSSPRACSRPRGWT